MFGKLEYRVYHGCRFQIAVRFHTKVIYICPVSSIKLADYIINKLTPNGMLKTSKNFTKVNANTINL